MAPVASGLNRAPERYRMVTAAELVLATIRVVRHTRAVSLARTGSVALLLCALDRGRHPVLYVPYPIGWPT